MGTEKADRKLFRRVYCKGEQRNKAVSGGRCSQESSFLSQVGDYNLFVFDGNDPEERMQLLMRVREATPERATF